MGEKIEVGDTVFFLNGKVHWSVKSIDGNGVVELASQMSSFRRTAWLHQLRLHSKGTGDVSE